MPRRQPRRGGGRDAAQAQAVSVDRGGVDNSFWGDAVAPVARGLLTSAVVCFADRGYHATTTRDITSTLGLSPGALYVHFSSKEEVLYEIARTGHERALQALQAQPSSGDTSSYMGRLIASLVEWHARHHTVARVCQHELAALNEEHFATVRELRQQFSAILRSALERGVQEGVFDAPDINRSVRAIQSLGIDLVRWYRADGADSPQVLGQFYSDLALRMIGSTTAKARPTTLS
jgi:AcrR family transcriptional regulator